jgi:hypothetical protein
LFSPSGVRERGFAEETVGLVELRGEQRELPDLDRRAVLEPFDLAVIRSELGRAQNQLLDAPNRNVIWAAA